MIYRELFFVFLKVGLFSFGGGYAMLSLLQQEILRYQWMSIKEFTDMVAISQITPGPIAVNMATFVGYRQAGMIGSLIATAGVIFPSLVIVLLLARFFIRFSEAKAVKGILFGLRPVVAGLIAAAAIQIAGIELVHGELYSKGNNILTILEGKSIAITVGALIASYKYKIHPIWVIVVSALIGLLIF